MIKVVIVNSNLNVGGAESVLAEIARRMDRERFDVEVICLYEAGPIGERLRSEGVRVSDRFLRHKGDLAGAIRLARHLRRRRVDVFYYNNQPLTQLWGWLAARIAGVAVVATAFHFTFRRPEGAGRGRLLNRLLGARVDVCFVLSERQEQYVIESEHVPAEKIVVVPNGIDTRRVAERAAAGPETRSALGIPASATVVGIVAQLRPEKNHEMFLRVARGILTQHPATRFLVVGGGDERARLERVATELGVSDAVSFLGTRSDVAELMGACDIGILSSHGRVETFPLSVLEFMAAGRPVVSTDVGAVDEIIAAGETGEIVAEDSVDEMVAAVNALIADPVRREEMGRAARARAFDRFDTGGMVGKTEEVLEAAVRGRRRDEARTVIVVGPRPRLQGGVTTHIRTLLSGGLRDRFDLVHLEVGFSEEAVSRLRRIIDGVAKLMRLRSLLRLHPGALVHLNPSMDTRSFLRDIPLLLLASRSKAPTLVQFHGGLMDEPRALRPRVVRALLARALQRADLVLVLSRLQARSIARAFGEQSGLRIEELPALFLDLTPYEQRAATRSAIGGRVSSFVFVGRVIREKGVGELLDAVAALRAGGHEVVLRIAGSGPDEEDLRRKGEELGLGGAVEWHGWIGSDQKLDLLARSDVFVLPSRWLEGLPNALVEALAMGLPVIVSDIGAMAEVVVEGVNGFVVPPGNPETLEETMLYLIEHPAEAATMAERNRVLAADRFGLAQQVDAFTQIYGAVRTARAQREGRG